METRLFDPEHLPAWTTAEWYAGREAAPHLDQPIHVPRLEAAAHVVRVLLESGDGHSVSDLGCGDGGLLSLLPAGTDAWGYDLQPSNVAAARPGCLVEFADFLNDPVRLGDIVVLTEVLEHLVDPGALLIRLRTFVPSLEHSRWVVATSPRLETAEDHYEFHLWAWDMEGYGALFKNAGWYVMSHVAVGSFQLLVAVAEAGL